MFGGTTFLGQYFQVAQGDSPTTAGLASQVQSAVASGAMALGPKDAAAAAQSGSAGSLDVKHMPDALAAIVVRPTATRRVTSSSSPPSRPSSPSSPSSSSRRSR